MDSGCTSSRTVLVPAVAPPREVEEREREREREREDSWSEPPVTAG